MYNNLTDLVKGIPKHNVIVIGGDINAKIGDQESHGLSFQQETNRNGQFLLEFTAVGGLTNLNM